MQGFAIHIQIKGVQKKNEQALEQFLACVETPENKCHY